MIIPGDVQLSLDQAPTGYEFDVFISYRREDPYGTWLRTMFLREFEPALNDCLDRDVRIFCDYQSIPLGTQWPGVLRRGVQCSRAIVPIWAARYFRSAYCLAEWKSFVKRGADVVLPIFFTNPKETLKLFPGEAQTTQSEDFHMHAYWGEGFVKSEKYLAFLDDVRRFAKKVAAALDRAPPFDLADPRFEPQPFGPEPAPAKISFSTLSFGAAAR